MCLLGIQYTTVLQSAVVAPQLHYSELSFEDMVHQNFTFLSTVSEAIKSAGEVADKDNLFGEKICPGQDDTCLQKETLLGRNVKPVSLEVGSMASVLFQLSLKNRRVLVEENVNRRLYANIIKVLGRNAVEGRERFFANAFYWKFKVDKPWMLVKTLERMHSFVLVRNFRQKFETQYTMNLEEAAKREALSENITRPDDNGGKPVGFTDSIVSEAFLLLLYCVNVCLWGLWAFYGPTLLQGLDLDSHYGSKASAAAKVNGTCALGRSDLMLKFQAVGLSNWE